MRRERKKLDKQEIHKIIEESNKEELEKKIIEEEIEEVIGDGFWYYPIKWDHEKKKWMRSGFLK
jgi:hypothetical protein